MTRPRVNATIATQRVREDGVGEDRPDQRGPTGERRENLPAREAEQRRFEIVGWDEA